jgi:catechol 2,3-dioxygenase-like lactoylglutathione lyase family enzyme
MREVEQQATFIGIIARSPLLGSEVHCSQQPSSREHRKDQAFAADATLDATEQRELRCAGRAERRRSGADGVAIVSFHHIEIRVGDFESRLSFWDWLFADTLGLERFQQWDAGRSWRFAGGPYIVLAVGQTTNAPDHLAFAASRQTVDAIWSEVEAHGGQQLYADEHPYAGGSEHYAANVLDPGGMKIEIVAKAET